jgi:RecJ-like exonuclease
MDVDACLACGDTGRIQVVVEHSDTDKTVYVEECGECGDELSARNNEESN